MNTSVKQKHEIYERLPFSEFSNEQTQFLVPYDGGLGALAALQAAIRLTEPGTEIVALSFVSVPPTQPVDICLPNAETRAMAVLAAAIANAAMRGIKIRTEIIHCHAVGPALVQRASRGDSNVIFLGVEHADLADHVDSLADYLLRFAHSKVVVVQL